jgi:hypothetical protein
MLGGLKKLDRIPEWIIKNNLGSTGTRNDFIPKAKPGSAKLFYFLSQIRNLNLDAIPSTWGRCAAIRHWAPA